MAVTDLRALEAAATPGPWSAEELPTFAGSPPDGDLVAAARNALPYLLDVHKAARLLAECPDSATYHRALRKALDNLDAHLRGETP